MYKTLIIDGYVDEPSCLGVPPFISPYVRYIFGLLKSSGKEIKTKYISIDELRKIENYNENYLADFNLVIVFAGLTVPGKYFNAKPITFKELKNFRKTCKTQTLILCGPIWRGYQYIGGKKAYEYCLDNFDFVIKGYPETGLKSFLETGNVKDKIFQRDYNDINVYCTKGSEVVRFHPYFPYLICEVETFQGCRRDENCSFCIEGLNKKVIYREEEDIINEVIELYKNGVRYFRIGNQTDIFSYKFDNKPNFKSIKKIFKQIREKCPDIKVLHTDNASPAVITNYKESEYIIQTLVDYTTSGNSLPLGLESADEKVIRFNQLNSTPEETLEAMKLINKYGNRRGNNGLPQLLPAVNFIYGLLGENRKTWKLNYEFLKRILDEGLLLRRINLRQAMIFKGTKLDKYINLKKFKKFKNHFLYMKEKIRKEIDRKMLKRVLPLNTILKDVRFEKFDKNVTFGRQLGSYPILVGVRGKLELEKFYDVKIVDYGFRSVTGELVN